MTSPVGTLKFLLPSPLLIRTDQEHTISISGNLHSFSGEITKPHTIIQKTTTMESKKEVISWLYNLKTLSQLPQQVLSLAN